MLSAPAVAERAEGAGEVVITYIREATRAATKAAPKDEGIAGARLGLGDNNGTGRFLGQEFRLGEIAVTDDDAADPGIHAGGALLVADLSTRLLMRLAGRDALRRATILNIAVEDDTLRQDSCRANLLHVTPSGAMLADALAQYFVAKGWRRALLLSGREAADRAYAEALRGAARKFRLTLAADREWSLNPAMQRADTGHFQVNREVAEISRAGDYDVVLVADRAGKFGDAIAYRTDRPRPIAGTHGLTATAWSPIFDEYGATQLQSRFRRQEGRAMTARDYAAWLAVRALGEAATRTRQTAPERIGTYLRGSEFALAGYKGAPLSFRAWDGQLRQPLLLVDGGSLVSISPQPGFLHQFNTLDTLGTDQPESRCRLP
jgi:ABC transporter substrate binding protein (PQQ-dependent alcohol dehydrogenase system)